MKRLLLLFAGVLALAPLAASAAERLHLIEHAVNENTVHVGAGAKGDSLGDMIVFANPVNNATDKTQAGTDNGYCVRVVVGKSWECFWTLKLKDGMITIEGPFYDTGDSVFVITGGTASMPARRGR